MANFFAELKRRHIYRVGAAYVVVAWALTQVVDILSQVFELPAWIAQPALVLLAIGFPIVLIATWMIESKPHEAVVSAVRSKSTTIDWMLFGAVALLITITGYQQIASPRQAGVDAARAAAASPLGGVSVAVLPFANVSADPEQEFFSDGITDEISGALAKIPDLRVVGRTSAFQYKTRTADLRVIGQALNATHLIEGSVRKAGDRVRITVQLIRTENGLQLWSENYDRELTDIFAIQEDIARAIATSFNMQLGLKPGENLVNNRNIDPDLYQQFLRSRALYRARGLKNLIDSASLLEQVVARDPNYAPAWALLSLVQALTPNFVPRPNASVEEERRIIDDYIPKAEAAAQRAVELDANSADGYISLAQTLRGRGKFLPADEMYRRALALDPSNADALHTYSLALAFAGRLKESLAMREPLHSLEPFVPVYKRDTAQILWSDGQNEAAIAILNDLPQERAVILTMIKAAEGRFSDAADSLLAADTGTPAPNVQEVVRLLRAAPAPVASPPAVPLGLLFIYLKVGAPDRVLQPFERAVEAGYFNSFRASSVWHPVYAPVRKTERFKTFVRKVGLVDYWRAKGWPPQCHPTTGDDFACN